jgi:hypothetical protein
LWNDLLSSGGGCLLHSGPRIRLRSTVDAWSQAGSITKGMEQYCANDYKKFCGEYGLQTSALNLCMRKAGPSLSPACVQALVQAGRVSQAEVDRIKAQMKGR